MGPADTARAQAAPLLPYTRVDDDDSCPQVGPGRHGTLHAPVEEVVQVALYGMGYVVLGLVIVVLTIPVSRWKRQPGSRWAWVGRGRSAQWIAQHMRAVGCGWVVVGGVLSIIDFTRP